MLNFLQEIDSKLKSPEGVNEIKNIFKLVKKIYFSIFLFYFFSQCCGVISNSTGKMCTKTLNCPQHTDENRKEIRIKLLGNEVDLEYLHQGTLKIFLGISLYFYTHPSISTEKTKKKS